MGTLDREKVAAGKETLDCCLCQQHLKPKLVMKVVGDVCLVLHVPCCSLGGRNQTVSQLFLGVSLVRMSTLNCAMMETVQSMTLLDFLPHLLHRS